MNRRQQTLILAVRVYRLTISPAPAFLFGAPEGCRFTPSGSQHAMEAIRDQGAAAGSILTVKRLCRCHPWGGCGHDPVPQAGSMATGTECTVRAAGNPS